MTCSSLLAIGLLKVIEQLVGSLLQCCHATLYELWILEKYHSGCIALVCLLLQWKDN